MDAQPRSRPVLLLVRHGITAPQQQHRYCGHSDPPLAPEGGEQMRRLGRDLAARFPAFDAVATSDSARALASAAILSERAPWVISNLREIHFGDWEGLRFDETGCRDPEVLRSPDFQFPGGESARMLHARVERALAAILADAPARTLIVAHAGPLAMIACLLREQPWEQFWNHLLPPGGSAILEYRRRPFL